MIRLEYRGVDVNLIRDPGVRTAFVTLEENVRTAVNVLRQVVSSETQRGEIRIKAPIIPRQLAADPRTNATFGEIGELALGPDGVIYRKTLTTKSDTNWEATSAAVDPDSTFLAGLGDVPVSVNLLPNATGVSGRAARADHKHDLDETIEPTWTGAHVWAPTDPTDVPITITAASGQTADLLAAYRDTGGIAIQVDPEGKVGINDDPDAMLTIRNAAGGNVTEDHAALYWPNNVTGRGYWKGGAWNYTDSYTFDAWVKIDASSDTSTWQNVFVIGSNTAGAGGAAYVHGGLYIGTAASSNTGELVYFCFNSSTGTTAAAESGTVLTDGTWHHIAVVHERTGANSHKISIFVDGTLNAESSGSSASQPWSNASAGLDINIGSRVNVASNAMKGVALAGIKARSGRHYATTTDGSVIGNDIFVPLLPADLLSATLVDVDMDEGGGIPVDDIGGPFQRNHTIANDPVWSVQTIDVGQASSPYDLTRWKDSGGSVLSRVNELGWLGIGVDPSYPLHVVLNSGEQVRIAYDATNYLSTTVSSVGLVQFNAAGASSAFRFDDSVGINRTPTTHPLEVQLDRDAATRVQIINANTGASSRAGVAVGPAPGGTNYGYIDRFASGAASPYASNVMVYSTDTAKLFLGTAATARMGIDASGRIGIGSASFVGGTLAAGLDLSHASSAEPSLRITRPAAASFGDAQLRLAYDGSNYSEITEWQSGLSFAGTGTFYTTGVYDYQFRGNVDEGAWLSLHAGPWSGFTGSDDTSVKRSLRVYVADATGDTFGMYHSVNVNSGPYGGDFIWSSGVLNLQATGNTYDPGLGDNTGVTHSFGIYNSGSPGSGGGYVEIRDERGAQGAGVYQFEGGIGYYRALTQYNTLSATSPITITAGGQIASFPAIGFDQTAALGNNARVAVNKNSGATVGTRRRINFIEGSNVTITVADDAGNEEIDVTITSSISGGTEPSDGDKGDISVTASGLTWTIDNDVVTYAKMQNVSATQRILGRTTAGAGDVEELSINGVLSWLSTTRGAILRYGASGWEGYNPGTATYVLTSNGAGADPTWQALPGGSAAWTTMSDGTNTASPTGADTFRFRTTTDGISLTVTNDEAVFGDNLKIDLVFANPSGVIGLSANNGTSENPMRADATPMLSQGIEPVWTGTHTFTQNATAAIALTADRWIDFNGTRVTGPTSGGVQLGHTTSAQWSVAGATPAASSTGWSVSNEDGTTKSFDANSVDLDTIADVLGNLIEVLKVHGILRG